uniref:BRICHOS domain-containing protein n=1 Tax=Ascaris lumbricoides TaxID=6252 RepID=A0A0M3I6U6_ASCLU
MSTSSQPQQINSSSTMTRSGGNIDSYGYDVHEVHTSEGGARIVQTHGSGLIHGEGPAIEQRDRSISEQRTFPDRSIEQRTTLIEERTLDDRRPGITSALKSGSKEVGFLGSVRSAASGIQSRVDTRPSVYTVPTPSTAKNELWRSVGAAIGDTSLSRKDSYKRMQQGQLDESADIYLPRSDASLMTGTGRSHSETPQPSPSCWERVTLFFRKLFSRIENTRCTPRLLCLLLLLLVLLLIFFILLGVILNAIFGAYSVRKLVLFPPICEECRQRSPNGVFEQTPSILYVHYNSPSQAHFELVGNSPFKSNSFTAIDFNTGYIAIADHALTDSHGKHTTCFVMPLDRTAMPSMSALQDALRSTESEVQSEFGWQEYWQYQAEPIDALSAERKFTERIADCINAKWYLLKHTVYTKVIVLEVQSEFGWQEYWQYQAEPIDALSAERKFTERIADCINAKWYLLKHTVYTKDSGCSDCYDFCLPDYGVQRLHKYADDVTVGIRRLDCFRLYVPEWAKYQITPDSQGGHWSYPKIASSTQRDASGNWVNWSPIAG